MVEREVEVINRAGLHARPSALIAKVAQKYKADITLSLNTIHINAKSVMGIITLGATYETKLNIRCEGEDENEALEAIALLFENRFEEVKE